MYKSPRPPLLRPKTELIHWRAVRQKEISDATVTIGTETFRSSRRVKWLGYWFSDDLLTRHHFEVRLVKAKQTFQMISRLTLLGKGLTSASARRLAQSPILPILSYGAQCSYPPPSVLHSHPTFWNMVMRCITNCFRSTNDAALHREASFRRSAHSTSAITAGMHSASALWTLIVIRPSGDFTRSSRRSTPFPSRPSPLAN